jgi:hypothetical protein
LNIAGQARERCAANRQAPNSLEPRRTTLRAARASSDYSFHLQNVSNKK